MAIIFKRVPFPFWSVDCKYAVSVTNSAYVLTGNDCSSLCDTWLCPIFIFSPVLYDCSFGESQILIPWLVCAGLLRPRFGALVRGDFWQCQFVCGECDSELSDFHSLWRQPGGWLVFCMEFWYPLDFLLVQVYYWHGFRIPSWCPTIGSDVPSKLETGVRLRNVVTPCVGAWWIWVVIDFKMGEHWPESFDLWVSLFYVDLVELVVSHV